MATYYVRKTGSDAAAGTSAGAAWQTIGKALGAAGIASGDTVYIGAGTYREVVTVAMTSATVETLVIGDMDGSHTGDAGEVIWTAYLTNDTTAPSATATLDLNGKNFLTFRRLTMVAGTGRVVTTGTGIHDVKFQDCYVLGHPSNTSNTIALLAAFGVAANITIERCWIRESRGVGINVVLTTGVGSDYDANIVIRNCLIEMYTATSAIQVGSSGTSAQEGGGVYVYNCTILSVPTDPKSVV